MGVLLELKHIVGPTKIWSGAYVTKKGNIIETYISKKSNVWSEATYVSTHAWWLMGCRDVGKVFAACCLGGCMCGPLL